MGLSRLWRISVRLGLSLAFIVACLACTGMAAADDGTPVSKPKRIVSVNLCTDQILIDLVPRDRIAALSYVAADKSVSAIAGEVAGLRLTRGGAEDVLALSPDLILAGQYAATATTLMLQRLGRRVVVVPLANDLKGIRAQVRLIAAAVGEKKRGERLIRGFDARLAALRKKSPSRSGAGAGLKALVYGVGSRAAGSGGLAEAMLRAAGLHNYAAGVSLGSSGQLPLETMLLRPPDLIVLGHGRSSYLTIMADNLRHPAFVDLISRRPLLVVPQALYLCGTLRTMAAIEQLAQARLELTGGTLGTGSAKRVPIE